MILRRKFIITYLLVALVPLILVALLSYTNTRAVLLSVQQRTLENIAGSKEFAINSYFSHFYDEMVAVQSYYNIKLNLPIITRLINQTNDPEYTKAKKMLDAQLTVWAKGRQDIFGLKLVDPAGNIVYSIDTIDLTGDQSRPLSDPGGRAFEEGSKGVFVSDLFVDARHGNAILFLTSAPIYDFDDNFIGVVVLEVNAQKLLNQIQDTAGLGETGEALIFRRVAYDSVSNSPAANYDENGNYLLYLNSLRFDPQAAFQRVIRIGSSVGLPAQEAVLNRSGGHNSSYKDYRGESVFAVWRYLPTKNWGMVVKMDMDELLQPLNVIARSIIIFGLVAVLSIILIAWILARTISSPIAMLTDFAKKIGKGKLDISIDEQLLSASDEVGVLAKTLADSSVSLRDLHNNLEQKVKDRTEKLEQSEALLKKTLADSERINKLMVGRELKMMEIKKQINQESHED